MYCLLGAETTDQLRLNGTPACQIVGPVLPAASSGSPAAACSLRPQQSLQCSACPAQTEEGEDVYVQPDYQFR